MKFYIDSKDSGKLFEISDSVTKISFEDKLNDGCSKLTFSYIDDALSLENGDGVRFEYKELIFVGQIFKITGDKSREVSVIAYDQLRYAKGKDYFSSKGNTLTSLTKKMCLHFGFNQGTIVDTGYILATQAYDGDTWLDIVYSGVDETLTYKRKWFILRDEGGYIALRNIADLALNLILGDQSLCYDFSYEKSIDDNFYNQIIILAKGKDENSSSRIVGSRDERSMEKYGPLQYYESVSNKTITQAQDYADSLLSLYNEESKTLSLDCLGDSRIRAGNSIYGQIKCIGLDKRLVVRSVTHDFIPIHTMKIEVII